MEAATMSTKTTSFNARSVRMVRVGVCIYENVTRSKMGRQPIAFREAEVESINTLRFECVTPELTP